MLYCAIQIAKRQGSLFTIKINTRSVSLHYYPNSGTKNWFYRGRGVSNKGDIVRWLGGWE
jgi:hypothetical protein